MKRKILIIMLTATLLTGCGNDKLREGEIYAKEYTPAHSTTRIIPIVISNGKTFSTVMIPYVYHYPDSYCVKIREYDEEAGEYDTAKYYTTEEVYSACEIGGGFAYSDSRDYEELPYTREKK